MWVTDSDQVTASQTDLKMLFKTIPKNQHVLSNWHSVHLYLCKNSTQ